MIISEESIKTLQVKTQKIKAVVEDPEVDLSWLSTEWEFLKNSETKMIMLFDGQRPGEDVPGEVEMGPILYLLHHLPEGLGLITDGLKLLGMPDTAITEQMWDTYVDRLRAQGYVAGDGTLIAGDGSWDYYRKYVQYDPGWAVAAFEYFLLKTGIDQRAVFGKTPVKIVVPQDVGKQEKGIKIALIGDWGTGYWTDGQKPKPPSQLVMEQVESLKPDYIIHLGDVYYAGTGKGVVFPDEEETNFTNLWKAGSRGTFTLNSNHEMYSGARGYFEVALCKRKKNLWEFLKKIFCKIFCKCKINQCRTDLFLHQKKTSYFSLEYGPWLILGLDSAYYDPSPLFMDGALRNDHESGHHQIKFMKEAAKSDKHIIVLTHHTGMDIDGDTTNVLWDQVMETLKDNKPKFWYWGHVHNGIVFSEDSTAGKQGVACRCSGHGAIPFGDGYTLQKAHAAGKVSYYANTPMPDADTQQKLRVLNGFAMITLNQHSITEQFFETGQKKPVWEKKTNL